MSTDAPSESSTAASGIAEDASIAGTFDDAGADHVDTVAGSYVPAEAGGTADASETDGAAVETDGAAVSIGTDPGASVPPGDGESPKPDVSLLVREGDVAADYLEQLLDIVDYDGDIDLDVENGRAIVAIVGSDLHPLVGAGGATLDALQELTRLAVQQQTGVRSRLMLDISGHRSNRRKQLAELAQVTAEAVARDGEPVRLAPMNPFERKVVHDAISAIDGVRSESEGDEPQRRVVVHPAR